MANTDLKSEQELLITGISRENHLLHVGIRLEEIIQKEGAITSIRWVEPNGPQTQSSIVVKMDVLHANELKDKAVISSRNEDWNITANRPTKSSADANHFVPKGDSVYEEEPMAVDEEPMELHEFHHVLADVNGAILECIKKSEYVFFRMQKVFQYLAIVQRNWNPVLPSKMALIFKPVTRKELNHQTQKEFEANCVKLLKRFFSLLTVQRCPFPTGTLSEKQKHSREFEITTRKVEGDVDHEFLICYEYEPGAIVVAGMEEDVALYMNWVKERIVGASQQSVTGDLESTVQPSESTSESPEQKRAQEMNEMGQPLATDKQSESSMKLTEPTALEEYGATSAAAIERTTDLSSNLNSTPSSTSQSEEEVNYKKLDKQPGSSMKLAEPTTQEKYGATSTAANERTNDLSSNSNSTSSSASQSKDEVNYKKLDGKNFSKTFSWFQLLQEDASLFSGNEDRCILIQNLPSSCSYKDLRKYFRGNGCLVSRIIRIQDGVLVVFLDISAVKLVMDGGHFFGEEKLKIVEKQIPKIDNKRLLIEGTYDDKDGVLAILDGCMEMFDGKVMRIEKSNRYLIRFSEETDILGLIKKIKDLPLSTKPRMARLCCSDCIKITGVAKLSEDKIQLICVKLKIAITYIRRERISDNVVLLYLRDYKDADSLINTTIEHRTAGTLKITNYIQDIAVIQEIKENFDFSKEIIEPNTSDNEDASSPGPQETHKKKRKLEPFECRLEFDLQVIELVYKSNQLQLDLREHLIGLAKIELTKLNGFFARFSPCIQQKKDYDGNQSMFERDCQKATKQFVKKFVSEKHNLSSKYYRAICKKYRKRDERKSLIPDDDMHLLVEWDHVKDGAIRLTGSRRDVDNFKQMFDEKIENIPCSEPEYQILDGCGILDAAARELGVNVTKCNNSYNLIVQGTSRNVLSAQRMMDDEKKDIVTTSNMSFLDEVQVNFLQNASRSKVESFVQNRLNEGGLKVLFKLEDGPVLFHKRRDLEKSKKVLKKLVQSKTFDLDDDIERIESDQDWKDVRDFVDGTGTVRLYIKRQQIILVGLSPHFEEVKARIDNYFSQISEKEDMVKMDAISKSFICNFTSVIDGCDVLKPVEFNETPHGIWMVGKKRNVVKASNWLNETVKSLKTTSKTIEEPWKVKYLFGEPGKQFLKTVQADSHCFITIEKDEVDSEASVRNFVAPKTKQWDQKYQPPSGNNLQRYPNVKIPGTDVSIRLVKGDITLHQADAIVNASNPELELRSAGVSGSILRQGGNKIQMEMDQRRREIGGRLRTGQAVTTSSGNLTRCKKIVHVSGPVWYDRGFNDSSVCLKKSVIACLLEAGNHNLLSIAIPAISCGVFGGKAPISAKLIMQAILEYFQGNRTSSVKQVDLIEISSREIIDEFSKQLHELSSSFSSLNISNSFSKGKGAAVAFPSEKPRLPFEVFVERGDILNTRVDCIVNTAGPRFDLRMSQLSQKLLKKAGPRLENECHANPMHTSKVFRVTSGGSMPFRRIVHLMVAANVKHLTNDLEKVFEFVDNVMMMKSLAVPAIGTGNAGSFTKLEAVNAIKQAIEKFRKINPKYLKTIRIVIFEDNLFKLYHTCLRCFITPPVTAQPSSSNADYSYSHSIPELPPLVKEHVKEQPPLSHSRRTYGAVMLLLCSTQESNFEKACRLMRHQFEKRFADATAKNLDSKLLTDEYVATLKETHTVEIKTDRELSNTTAFISGLQEDVSLASKAIKAHAGNFGTGGSSKAEEDEWVR